MAESVGTSLGSPSQLRPQHAVAALLQLADGRYVMQLRDSSRGIFYPDHWGCFGGAVDFGETPEQAIVRELEEELHLKIGGGDYARFTEFTFDFGFCGSGRKRRIYYEILLPISDTSKFRLGEGAEVGAFDAESFLVKDRIVPYDAFAIWMHYQRARFGGTGNYD